MKMGSNAKVSANIEKKLHVDEKTKEDSPVYAGVSLNLQYDKSKCIIYVDIVNHASLFSTIYVTDTNLSSSLLTLNHIRDSLLETTLISRLTWFGLNQNFSYGLKWGEIPNKNNWCFL